MVGVVRVTALISLAVPCATAPSFAPFGSVHPGGAIQPVYAADVTPSRSYSSPVCETMGIDVYWADDETFTAQEGGCGLLCGEKVNSSYTSCIHGVSQDGNSAAQTLMVGPFTSTGGFDWWQMGGAFVLDPFNSSAESSLVTRWSVTVWDTTTGEQLGFPPLHNHHSAFTVGSSYMPIGLMAGDRQCTDEVDGFECLTTDYEGRLWPLPSNLGLNMIINDARPAGSEPLTWYMNFTLEAVRDAAASVERMSHYFLRIAGLASSVFYTQDYPENEDAFGITTGVWNASGVVKTVGFHAHMSAFDSSFIFAGTPKQLGLDQPLFQSWSGCDPVTAASAGFTSNHELLDHLKRTLPQSFSLNPPQGQSAKLLWASFGDAVQVNETWYDRQSSFDRVDGQFKITAGQPFTVLSFFGPKPETPFLSHLAFTEGFGPQHVDWQFDFVPDDDNTTYTVHYAQSMSASEYNETRCAPLESLILSSEM